MDKGKGKERNGKRPVWYWVMIICVLAALLIAVWDRAEAPPMPEDGLMEMDDGWTYRRADGSSVRLDELHGKLDTPAGQAAYIENVLPDMDQDGVFLCFRSSQQSVRVYVDQRQIYEYDTSGSRPFSKSTPSAWNFVPVPLDSSGKSVVIETISPYAQNSGLTNPVLLGTYSAVELHILNLQFPQFIISVAILLLAFFMFLVSFWLTKSREMRRILHSLAFFIFMVGIWVFGESKMPHAFSPFNLMESSLAFYALFLLPMPYLNYMRFRLHARRQHTLTVLYYAALGNTAACTVLQVFQVADLIELLPAAHIMLVLAVGYTLVSLFLDRRRETEKGDGLELVGLIVLSICGAAELWLFYSNDFYNTGALVPLGLLVYLVLLSISTARKLLRRSVEAAELDEELQENRAQLLISQIQPHFIYNTLGAIQTYIMKSPNTAYKMVQNFSDYLRANIQSVMNTEPILFSTELKHVRAYTDIELIRFRNRIDVVYEIGPSDFYILPLTVQPLVENAIKHGLCGRVEGGTVWVRTQEDEQNYVITVEDNGRGFDVSDAAGKGRGVGLLNIHNRLELQMNAKLEIVSSPGRGTKVAVILPKWKNQEFSLRKGGEAGENHIGG